MAQETVLVPDIGGSDAAEVVEVLVSVGDSIEVDQGLIVLESDKASMEIPSTVAGTVVEMLTREGDELAEGGKVAVIETAGDESADESTDESAEDGEKSSVTTADPEKEAGDGAAPANAGESEKPTESKDQGASEEGAGENADAKASQEVPVPDIGTDEAVDLIEIAVSVGDSIAEGDTLVVLETDKASMEVPSPSAGVVTALRVDEGQQVKQGDVLLLLEVATASPSSSGSDTPSQSDSAADSKGSGEATADASAQKPAQAAAAAEPKAPMANASGGKPGAGSDSKKVYAGPAVRRLAREFGVPLELVKSSGPRGRILKEDLHQYVSQALSAPESKNGGAGIPPIPDVDFASFGPVDVVERSKIDKVTAANMQRSWLNVPHVTQFDDADITEMEAFRKSLKGEAEKRGTRLTPLPFILKACAVALRNNEKINASLSDGGSTLTLKRYVHIGMAVDTPAGLVVPVIRDVDQKTLWELADEVIELAGKARDRKLKPAEMQGGGFTVSSLGSIGGRGFTPIVNAPEVAILGVSRAATQPVWDGQAFQPRLQLPLGLSYDHRVVNGGDAGRFLTELCGLLGDIRKLLL
ncbi:dihydrolipoyllysine-residue acetyltransferase [Congregibacter litoralis]|uniref:Acetyltransferase component of pyruvate dehydrogenase complex n=1 Tax=Congregibacter litoralis KT71 TaxID=314285 RepID=A4A5N6_9GAMM|nr:dihydrolipoyllysine-residue acetyltransferase [Congregibacter litoralis]EAQ98333.2 pyruvate dehydrogenase complex dihydrolipoamide acetyltransferase, long form [Congregibacter litoralis KT71]